MRLKEGFKHFIRSKIDKYSVQNAVFLFTLYMAFMLAGISIVANIILKLPVQIILFSLLSPVVLLPIHYLAIKKRRFTLAKNLFFVIMIIGINVLWFYSQGSSGFAFVMMLMSMPLIVIYSSRKQSQFMVAFIALNTIALLIVEMVYPSLVVPYPSPQARSIDVFIAIFIFFLIEVPALLLVNRIIIESKYKAEESSTAKTNYVTNLSHEIRTPMNAILGFTELLSLDDNQEEDRKHYTEVISQNGRQLINLLNNIINISKLESNNIKLSLTHFQPYSVLQEVKDALLPFYINNSRIEFRVDEPVSSDVLLESDASVLYQIISNLAYNAIKFTPKGEIVLGYEVTSLHILFSVRDTGKGIPKKDQSTIFERYKQVADTDSKQQKGSGLGLAIAQGLTSLLHGEIWFHSVVHKGTTFFVKLPLTYSQISQ
jgi:signal transduction histidine kinase